MTIRERGLVIQDMDQRIAGMKSQGMSEAQILRAMKRTYGENSPQFREMWDRVAVQTGRAGKAAPGAESGPAAAAKPAPTRPAGPGTPTTIVDEAIVARRGQPKVDSWEYPIKNLVVMDRVKQFKRGADPETGVVRGQALQGSFQREPQVAPILVWERLDQKNEVVTGRNRFDLAKRTGETTIPAQVVREADGFTQEKAERYDAEANIRDGQGEVSDYAHFFRHYPELTEAQAADKGLVARSKGRAGWALGRSATDDLYALYQAGRISEDKAVAISLAAPGNAALQAAGMEFSREQGVEAADVENYLETLKASAAERQAAGVQGDLFGFDDAALNEAKALAKAATRRQNEISRRLMVLRAGSKVASARFKEIAGEYGINVADPDALEKAQVAALEELDAWRRWATDPAKVAELRTGVRGKEPVRGAAAAGSGAAQAQADLSAGREIPQDALAALEELEADGAGGVRFDVRQQEGSGSADLAGEARGESPFGRQLRLIVEGRPTGQTSGRLPAMVGRELQRRASALLDALRARRIDEPEAERRWMAAQADVRKGQRKLEARGVPQGRPETMDMFAAPAGPTPGMLFDARAENRESGTLVDIERSNWQEVEYERREAAARETMAEWESGEPATYLGEPVVHSESSPGFRADVERYKTLRARRDRGEEVIQRQRKVVRGEAGADPEYVADWDGVEYSYSLAESAEFEDLLMRAERDGVELIPVHGGVFGRAGVDGAAVGKQIFVADTDAGNEILDHEEFHVARTGRSPAAARLISLVDQDGEIFGKFHAALKETYRSRNLPAPSRAVAAEEIAARYYAGEWRLAQGGRAYVDVEQAFRDPDAAQDAVAAVMDDWESGAVRVQDEMRFSVRGPGGSALAAGAAAEAGAGPGQLPGYRDRPVPADDPNHTMFPMELPEAVDFMRQLAGGLTFPKVRQKLRALRGEALGVYHPGPLDARVELKADIFNLIQRDDLIRLNAEAEAYVEANVPDEAEGGPGSRAEVKKAWLKDAIRKLREERLQENPRLAGEVAWHEIGHWIDDLPDWAVNRRSNILGHVAALKGYTKDMLAEVLEDAENLLSKQDRVKLRREAEKAVGKRPKKDDAAGIKAWREEVKAKYQEGLDAAADERGLVRRKTILAELEPAIAWWYGTEKMPGYYQKPEEMYAAAVSILANNPAALKARAPTYWALWHEYQVRRPEVRARWEEYQHAAATGRIQNERDRRQADAIRAADVAGEKAMRAKFNLTGPEFAEALGMFLFRGSLPVTLRAGRANAEVGNRALQALQDQLYHEGWASAYMLRSGNEVGRPVFEGAGVSAIEWSTFLQNMHIAENRQDIASMLGMNPAASRASMEEQRARLGDAAFEAMRAAGAKWAELRQRYVIDLARESGIWSEELWKIANERVWFSTVKGVDLDKDPLEAALRGMHGGEVGPRVYRQKGYLGAARDPWAATLELDRSLVAAAYRNQLKRAVHDLLADIQDPLFREGQMRFDRNTNRQVPETGAGERAETVVYLVDGKPRSFWAPKAVAEFIDSADPFSTVVFQRFLQMAARDIKGVFTFWNYGFPLFNTPRDIMDWVIKLPGWKSKATYRTYEKRAKPIVDSIVRGEPSPEAIEMLERNILMLWPQGLTPGASTTAQTLGNMIPGRVGAALQRTGPQTALERLARAYNVPGGWLGMELSGRQEMLHAAKEWYTRPTARGELLRKLAGWLFLEDRFPEMPAQEKQRQVQMMAGSPNFPDKAQGNWFADTFITFWNAAMRGTESTWKAIEWDVKNNRPYQADFWKTMLLTFRYGFLPKLLLAGLAAGWFRKAFQGLLGDETGGWLSDEYQKMGRSIPSYYKDNYATYPIWWDPTDRKNGKKVIFVTNPLSEHTRFGAGIMWKMIQGKDVSDLLNFGADQLPGFNPVGTVAFAWIAAAQGKKPGWVPMSQTQFDSGHWKGPMLKYTLNNLLGGMVGRFPRETIAEEFKSPLQKFLQAPVIGNTLGRRLRVSDAGWDDWYRNAATPINELEAQIRQDAYHHARQDARTGRIPNEALARYSRGAAILAGRPDDQIAGLPREQYADAYYAQRFRAYKRDLEIERLPADQRVLIKAKGSVRPALMP
jgi:hypothetical protein